MYFKLIYFVRKLIKTLARPAIRCDPPNCWQCSDRSCCAHPDGRRPQRRASGRGCRSAGPVAPHGSRSPPTRPRAPSRPSAADFRRPSSPASRPRSSRTPPARAAPSQIRDRAGGLRTVHCRWYLECAKYH